jgi:hypothetical protein
MTHHQYRIAHEGIAVIINVATSAQRLPNVAPTLMVDVCLDSKLSSPGLARPLLPEFVERPDQSATQHDAEQAAKARRVAEARREIERIRLATAHLDSSQGPGNAGRASSVLGKTLKQGRKRLSGKDRRR